MMNNKTLQAARRLLYLSEKEASFYMTHREYKADHAGATVLDWRLAQSLAAYLLGKYKKL